METGLWAGQTLVVSYQGDGRPSFSWHGVQTFKMITLWSHHIKVKGRTFQMPRQCARNDVLTHIKMLQMLVILLSQDNRLSVPLLPCPSQSPNIFLDTLFSNTLSLCSSHNVRDQVSHPYKTKGKIIDQYILIYVYFDSKLEDTKMVHQTIASIPMTSIEMGGACSMYGGRGEVYTGFWWGSLRERDHLDEPGIDGWIILRWIFRKWDVGALTGVIWLRTGTGGGHLQMR